MRIGLIDVDGHKYPNLALMKISAWHKAQGDDVSMVNLPTLEHYDKVYVSKVFGDEYSTIPDLYLNADEVVYGGTGFAITVENGKEVYHKELDKPLPYEIEHMYPDYSLYPELTKDTAYGYLTRGCCNNCSFCIVSKKEGMCSVKVADLNEFWRGQKRIELMDANILACRDRLDLIRQLAESNAKVNFNQGLDARFMTEETAKALAKVNIDRVHFAFDFMKNEQAIIKGLKTFKRFCPVDSRNATVYMLTNYDTTIQEDVYRVRMIKECGFQPDVRIYRKKSAPRSVKDLQRWCNSRYIYRSCELEDYVPRKDGKTFKELYME